MMIEIIGIITNNKNDNNYDVSHLSCEGQDLTHFPPRKRKSQYDFRKMSLSFSIHCTTGQNRMIPAFPITHPQAPSFPIRFHKKCSLKLYSQVLARCTSK